MDADGNIWSLTDVPPGTADNVSVLALLFVVFVIGGAYFGGVESAFSALNTIRIESRADAAEDPKQEKRTKCTLAIAADFNRALTTLLIGNNITHIAAASVATVIASRLFGNSDTVALSCTVVTTLIVFLFSEMIPKSFANDRSETTALFCAQSLRFFMKLFYPLVAFFSMISSGVTKLMDRFIKHEEEPSYTEEELYDIIDTIEEEGVMNKEQGTLFKSALDFSETCAKDVMTMRDDISYIDISLSNNEILQKLRESNHTRLPIVDSSVDRVVGILQMRIFIREYLKNPAVDVRSLLLPAFYIAPDAKVDAILTDMRQHKAYLGLVVDGDHKTLGLVTIEDLLEELVGEIWDEDDVVDRNFIKLGGNRFRVNTHMTFGELARRLSIECPSASIEERPLLSLMIQEFGRMPEEEESFIKDHLEFTVDTVKDGKIETVVIRLLSDDDLRELTASETAEEKA